jgi:hypothetical protein
MSTQRNEYGLSRDIPEPIKRIVRQECGFGCVVCGASICQYAHLDPAYEDAREHAAAAIALLSADCHQKLDTKFWSMEKILTARRAPRCKQDGFSWGEFDFGARHPTIEFAGNTMRGIRIPILKRGQPLLEVKAPEGEGGPFRLSAVFADSAGRQVLQIVDNEWRAEAGNWDVEFSGGRISIREARGRQCLVLRSNPPDGIAVERLRMHWDGADFEGDTEKLTVRQNGGSITFSQNSVFGGVVAFSLP